MKYTVNVGGIDKVFSAENIYAAQKYATSQGWNPGDVVTGDWPKIGKPAVPTVPSISLVPTVPSISSGPSVPTVASLKPVDLWETRYFDAAGKETIPSKAVVGPVETAKLLGKEPPPWAVPAGTKIEKPPAKTPEPELPKPPSVTDIGAGASEIPAVEGSDYVKNFLQEYGYRKNGFVWKDDYVMEGGFDLVKMLDDSYDIGCKFTPNNLRDIFGRDAVREASNYLPEYRAYNAIQPYTRVVPSDDYGTVRDNWMPPLTHHTEIKMGDLIDDKGVEGAVSLLDKVGVEGAKEFVNAYQNMPTHWQDYADQYSFIALQNRVNNYSNTLKDYKQEDGSYDIYQALIDPNSWVEASQHQGAISFLFGAEVTAQSLEGLRSMRMEVQAPSPVPEGIENKGGVANWFKGVKEFLTPWEEEKGQGFIEWMQRPGTMIGDIRRRLTKDEGFKEWYDAQGYPDLVYGYGPMITPATGIATPVLQRATQAVGKAAKWYWTAPSNAIMKVATKIPGLMTTPIIRGIPQMAATGVRLVTVGVPAVYTASYIAEKVRDSDLNRKWNLFTNLPEGEKDKWAQKLDYEKWGGLTESEQAAVLAAYAVPTSYTTTEWANAYGQYIEKLVELGKKGSAWIMGQQSPVPDVKEASVGGKPVKYIGAFGVGAGVGLAEGLMYMGAIPMMLTNIAVRVPTKEAWEYTKWVAGGMMEFFKEVPGTFISGPYGAGRMIGLFVLSPESIYKIGKGALTTLRPSYVPERGMGMRINTLRVVFTAKQLDLLSEMSSAELKLMGTRIGESLMKGKNYVKDFGRIKLEVKTVPYQKVVGNALYHFTPDITPFIKGKSVPIVGKLYASPHAAMSAGIQSLVKGTKAIKPGLVEIRVPEGYTIKGAPIEKLLASGRAIEIEAPLKGTLEPIRGLTGKGVSSNMYFGSYPIRRFTLQGVDTPVVKLTPKKLLEIRALAAKEALADAFLGWNGRLEAIKRDLAGSKQLRQSLKNIDESISTVKRSPDSVVGKNGEIIKQIEFKHPSSGKVNEKVRGLIIDKDGRVLFTRDRADPVGVYDAVGGSCNVKEVLLPEKGKWNYDLPAGKRPPITWELAFRSQVRGELDIVLRAKDVKSLGMYRGKVGEHSVYGVRAYEAKVGSPYFDRVKAWRKFQQPTYKYAEPEIAGAFWWDGKSAPRGAVQPWFYDMLAAVAKKYGWDMSKVKVSNVSGRFVRDLAFPERVSRGKNPDLTNKQRKAAEVGYLKDTYSRVMMPSFRDYVLRGGADIALAAELIRGRRQAVKWTLTGKTADLGKTANSLLTTARRLLREDKGGIDISPLQRALDAWERSKTKANARRLQTEINKVTQRFADLANKWLMESNIRDYLDSGVISGRYTTYLDKLARASVAGQDVSTLPIWNELPDYKFGDLPSAHYILNDAERGGRQGFTYTTGYSIPTYSELNKYPNYAKQATYQKAAKYQKPSKYVPLTYKVPEYKVPPKTVPPKKVPPTHPYPPIPPTPPYPPRPPRPPKPGHPRTKVTPAKLGKEKRIRKGPALATWKQGLYYVSIFPPFRTKGTKADVVYSRTKPPWASVIAKGRHAPRKTLRSIGKVPNLIELPMGVVTARIKGGRHLTFSRRRKRTKRRE